MASASFEQLRVYQSAEQLADKFLIGELHQEAAPEFTDEYAKVVERLKGGRA